MVVVLCADVTDLLPTSAKHTYLITSAIEDRTADAFEMEAV
jgi:hypothetical protein